MAKAFKGEGSKRPQILAIDDAKAVRIIVQNVLQPYACDVHEATNGFTGLFAMERTSPDLILLDVSMPTMDGVEMLTMIKGHAELKKIPVIMLTSPSDHKVFAAITALGVNSTVMKPFKPETLLQKILEILPLTLV
jgi:CheY-like chemotaxis protein